jgi:hypothetical protein
LDTPIWQIEFSSPSSTQFWCFAPCSVWLSFGFEPRCSGRLGHWAAAASIVGSTVTAGFWDLAQGFNSIFELTIEPAKDCSCRCAVKHRYGFLSPWYHLPWPVLACSSLTQSSGSSKVTPFEAACSQRMCYGSVAGFEGRWSSFNKLSTAIKAS